MILWEEEITHSFAVITFTCAPAELFMKGLSGGGVMGERHFTNNAKSKKVIQWTKKKSQPAQVVSKNVNHNRKEQKSGSNV